MFWEKLKVMEATCLMLPPKNRAKNKPGLNAIPNKTVSWAAVGEVEWRLFLSRLDLKGWLNPQGDEDTWKQHRQRERFRQTMIGRGGGSSESGARDSEQQDMTLLKFRTEGKVKTEEYLRTNKVLKQHLSNLGDQYQQVRALTDDIKAGF